MPFSADLRKNVPLHGVEEYAWSGAASAQMIMMGYPDPAHRLYYHQPDIWNVIQAHNSTDPADAGWATDPYGLRDCLMALNPPATSTLEVFSVPNRDDVMFQIMYWINKNRYPVAALTNGGEHWIVIVDFESDMEPDEGSMPTLQSVTYYDPEPHNVGTTTLKAASDWYQEEWVGPVKRSGTWFGNYVAFIEPPVVRAKAKVVEMTRTGEKTISPQDAVQYTRRLMDELRLWEKPPFAILRRKGIVSHTPILVREELKPGPEEKARVGYYYIVPFGFEKEVSARGVPLARVSIILNAFTGRFEEVGAFRRPVSYLPERDAVATATRALHLEKDEIKATNAVAMYQPSEMTHLRTYPFWRVTINDRALYVDQLGRLSNTIKPGPSGS